MTLTLGPAARVQQTAEPPQPQPIFKCDFCPCIFCTEKDLFMHMEAFGVEAAQHLEKWKRTHANLEGHYGEEE
jgi:hypothetical protein